MTDEWMTGQQAIKEFCATIADLACCDIGGQYNCFCENSDKHPRQAMVSKMVVDFALMAIRDVANTLRLEDDGTYGVIPEDVLAEYMHNHAASWQEEY